MLSIEQKTIIEASVSGIKPEPILTVSEWSDSFRKLSSRDSAEPGLWRTSRTPFLKKIMNCLGPASAYQHVIFQKGAQIGATTAGLNWTGYIMDRNPGPIMVVQPTLDMAKRYSKQRVDSMIEETTCLQSKIGDKRSRDSSNTVFTKEFDGGILLLTGANSAKGLRSMPIRFLHLDECDAYPGDVDNEGDPINLAITRTATFSRRKIFVTSTPTEAGRSNIEKLFQVTDQNYYFVPCIFCGDFQTLKFGQIVYEDDELGRPDLRTVRYKCESCDGLIPEHHKTEMLEHGEWRPTETDNISDKRIGFHLSSLYSPLGWYSWADAIEAHFDAQNNQEKLKGFVNTVLGETWSDKGDAPDWRRLYDRREDYKEGIIPLAGCVVTCGVDVQKDRLELELKAWGPGMENWSIAYRFIAGDTRDPTVWDELTKVLSETFDHESGRRLGVAKMIIDSGYNTQTVYNYVRKFPIQRVCAVKGSDSLQQIVARPKDVDIRQDGRKVRRGAKLFMMGSSMIKSEVYGWLNNDPAGPGQPEPFGRCHFPQYAEDYFKMLTAEELRKKKVKGFDKWYWEKIRDRNEALDLFVMNRAAAYMIGLDRYRESDWAKIQFAKTPKKLDNTKQQFKKKKIKRTKSSFWD